MFETALRYCYSLDGNSVMLIALAMSLISLIV